MGKCTKNEVLIVRVEPQSSDLREELLVRLRNFAPEAFTEVKLVVTNASQLSSGRV